MDLDQPHSVTEVAKLISARVEGNSARLVTGINEINRVRVGDLMFVDHPKYYAKALNSAATTYSETLFALQPGAAHHAMPA